MSQLSALHAVLKELLQHPTNFTQEHDLLLNILATCNNDRQITTGQILEYFRDHPKIKLLTTLAMNSEKINDL